MLQEEPLVIFRTIPEQDSWKLIWQQM